MELLIILSLLCSAFIIFLYFFPSTPPKKEKEVFELGKVKKTEPSKIVLQTSTNPNIQKSVAGVTSTSIEKKPSSELIIPGHIDKKSSGENSIQPQHKPLKDIKLVDDDKPNLFPPSVNTNTKVVTETYSKESVHYYPNIPKPEHYFSIVEKYSADDEYYVLWDYYPKNRFPQIDEPHSSNRIKVWNFKDGKNTKLYVNILKEALNYSFNPRVLQNHTLMIIPASTKEKTELRYSNLCRLLCESTGLNNGYGDIYNKKDREAIHLNNNRKFNREEYLEFSNNISGKHIMLLDDVMTTGESFRSIKEILIRKGAKSVKGIFLGKTY